MSEIIDITKQRKEIIKQRKQKEREAKAVECAKNDALGIVTEAFLYVEPRELWGLSNYIRNTLQGFWESQIKQGKPAPEWAIKNYEPYVNRNVDSLKKAKEASARIRKEAGKETP